MTLENSADSLTSDVGPDQAFIDDFARLSEFGATPAGGLNREAGSDADVAARTWLAEWLTARGFVVEYDEIGNQFGWFERVPGAPYVLAGSHLDSQPRGGRFDGAYGVLAAAHAADRLVTGWLSEERVDPVYNVGVVNWFNEEGSRFEPSMMGSSVFTGKLDLSQALEVADLSGVTVRDELSRAGMLGSPVSRDLASYAEIHIEQGRVLNETGTTIGVVDSTWAARKHTVTVLGEQSHTGSTVMADRQDALYGASLLVVAVREIADELSPALHASVARLSVYPNSPVAIARQVDLHIDLRSASVDVLDRAERLLATRVAEIEQRARVRVARELAHSWGVLAYQPEGVALALAAAEELGLPGRRMMTLAGHDSTNLKDVVPSVMMFVPSVGGVSHNEREFTEDHDSCAGVDLLHRVLQRLTAGELDHDGRGCHASPATSGGRPGTVYENG